MLSVFRRCFQGSLSKHRRQLDLGLYRAVQVLCWRISPTCRHLPHLLRSNPDKARHLPSWFLDYSRRSRFSFLRSLLGRQVRSGRLLVFHGLRRPCRFTCRLINVLVCASRCSHLGRMGWRMYCTHSLLECDLQGRDELASLGHYRLSKCICGCHSVFLLQRDGDRGNCSHWLLWPSARH